MADEGMTEETEEIKQERIVILSTHSTDDPERGITPLVIANAALAMDVEVIMILQNEGVRIAIKGACDDLKVDEFTPINELLKTFNELGGKFYVCSPCMKSRGLKPEDLIENAEVVAGAKVALTVLEANNTLCY